MELPGLTVLLILALMSMAGKTKAGLLTYGLCQTACNAGWVTCYATVGLVAGALTVGVALPAAALTCNLIQGVCMASCAATLLLPIP